VDLRKNICAILFAQSFETTNNFNVAVFIAIFVACENQTGVAFL